jgi:hypothetical protein
MEMVFFLEQYFQEYKLLYSLNIRLIYVLLVYEHKFNIK